MPLNFKRSVLNDNLQNITKILPLERAIFARYFNDLNINSFSSYSFLKAVRFQGFFAKFSLYLTACNKGRKTRP